MLALVAYKSTSALLKHGLFFVCNVKSTHNNFRKVQFKGTIKKGGYKASIKIIVPGMETELIKEVYDSIH